MANTIQISDAARDILKRSTITESTLTLPSQLKRPEYDAVMKAIDAAGGKWNKGRKCHVFTRDPREALGMIVEQGTAVNVQQTLQAFYTPKALAERMARLAGIKPGDQVLEPSAGEGALALVAAHLGGLVSCYEIDDHAIGVLRAKNCGPVIKKDFLEVSPDFYTIKFDVVLMNPPFQRGQAVKHTVHAMRFLRPGGRLVGLMDAGVLYRSDKATTAFRARIEELGGTFEKIPAGTFSESGTEVATVLLTVTMP